MWKIYKIYIKYYFFGNESKIQEEIVKYYNNNYFNSLDVKKFFNFFIEKTPKIFTDIFVKKLIPLMFANKDVDLSELVLKRFGIKSNTMNPNLFCQFGEKHALFSTNYMAWLFFILIEDKYSFCGFKLANDFSKNSIFDYDKTKKVIKNTILNLFLKEKENQDLIMKYVNPEHKELVYKLFLDLSLNNESKNNMKLVKI